MKNINILSCTCKHTFQDRTYGHRNRVFNRIDQVTSGSKLTWCCTVCKAEHITQEKVEELPKNNDKAKETRR